MIFPGSSFPRVFSRRKFLGLFGLASVAGTLRAEAAESANASLNPEVIEQRLGEGSCGPCALGNALLHGDAGCRQAFRKWPGAAAGQKLDALIARYGAKPSETYGPSRGRFVSGLGITNEDMPFLANDFLGEANLPKVRGEWLDQLPSENDNERAHLSRVHGRFVAALARGFPPVIEVRAFAADPAAPKAPWINLYAHWLALVGVEPMVLPPKSSGFLCRFADSFTGRIVPAFAYAERFRPFMATRGFSLKKDGSKDWHWLTGHPYILVDLPDVPLNIQTRSWQERSCVALSYMVSRPPAGQNG